MHFKVRSFFIICIFIPNIGNLWDFLSFHYFPINKYIEYMNITYYLYTMEVIILLLFVLSTILFVYESSFKVYFSKYKLVYLGLAIGQMIFFSAIAFSPYLNYLSN